MPPGTVTLRSLYSDDNNKYWGVRSNEINTKGKQGIKWKVQFYNNYLKVRPDVNFEQL